MVKNFLRLYIKISVIILTLILFLPITKLAAHDVTSSPWLFINDSPITEETENPIPNPSKLPWGEHVIPQSLRVGGSLKANVDRSVIVRDLEVTIDNIKTSYELTNTNGYEQKFDDDFSKVLSTTGNYFLKIELNRKDNNDEIVSESLMIIVGDTLAPTAFKVNGADVDITSASPTYNVTDNYNLSFEVSNPDNSKYTYTWDLGTGETKNGASIQYSFDKAKIPVYVVLRTTDKTTNVFVDSYVRVDSQTENTFEIPRPPVKIPPEQTNNNSLYIMVGLVGAAIIILSIVYYLMYRKKK